MDVKKFVSSWRFARSIYGSTTRFCSERTSRKNLLTLEGLAGVEGIACA